MVSSDTNGNAKALRNSKDGMGLPDAMPRIVLNRALLQFTDVKVENEFLDAHFRV